ncbi:resolvase-like protein [Bacillus oleivorans]|uniref:Resolvase-like protein n=1 Tax=Bacillus oleivorans TaxID=1448271 RepID=A0A285CUI7_9BACI|nr:recombinase family protein [Bacillus oleivorans]SNX71184.1 resolvase-like protein [Bacillus oleivorans]
MNMNNKSKGIESNQHVLTTKIKEIIAQTVHNLMHPLDFYLVSEIENPLLKPAIGYIRYSSLKQKDKYSVDIQKQEILQRAKEEGYYILLWCVDEAVSATHNRAIDRPWMQVLYQTALLDEFQGAIFFYDDSRISRQTSDFVLQVYKPLVMLRPYLKFYCSDYSGVWDPDDVLTQIRSLINSHKSEELRNKTLAYQSTILKLEQRPASHLPYGYIKGTENKPKIDVSNGQAYVVFLIYYLSSWGYSNKVIAKFLNACKIRSPKGTDWTQGTIDKILHNYFYLGHTSWNVRESRNNSKRKPIGQFELFPGTHTGIVPHYLGVLVDQIRNFKSTYGQKMETPFLLKDLLKCVQCDCVLEAKNTTSGKSNSSRRVYRCNSCKEFIVIDTIHEITFQQLFSYLSINHKQMFEGSKKLLNKWKENLKKQSKEIDKDKEYVIFLERTLDYELIGHEQELKQEANLMLSELQSIQEKILHLEEQIDILLEDENLETLFNNFFECKHEALSQTELRCFTLHFIKEIKYDFKTKKPAIEFSKTPFLTLEGWGKLTTN